jgi:hypothetical protein
MKKRCVAGHTPSVASSGVTTGFGFEFSIRTPGTPLRFREFSAELDLAWTALMSALVAFRARENEALDKLLHAALRLVFLWYNLMPLSRGSAALGAAALQGILLSAGLEQVGLRLIWICFVNILLLKKGRSCTNGVSARLGSDFVTACSRF